MKLPSVKKHCKPPSRKSYYGSAQGLPLRDPLIKRLPREFKTDFGKYAVIFLFMIMLISLVSGFLVADNSMLTAYEEGFEKYNIEHGHITFDKRPPEELLERIEEKADLTLYDLRYFEENIKDTEKTARVYTVRDTVNTICLMSGEMPSADDEIILDRMFAGNNKINVGDTVTLKNKPLKVTGLAAFPDYSSLYKSNTDMMFDALNFTVGAMTESGFEAFGSARVYHNYAWKYNSPFDRNDKIKANELSEKLIDTLEEVITEYDEDIVRVQIDELTEKLEKAGEEYAEFYLKNGRAPSKEELPTELDDFLFGIVEGAVTAKLKGEEYEMPADEEFENEIDKTDIIGLDDYVPLYLNKAVNFTGEDMGRDRAMFVLFSYIVIAVLAFIFAVTTSNTITAEAGVIGTLRASGYSRGELTAHYLLLPVSITLIAAVIGNILGYTVFRDIMADMYYNSYSLSTYVVIWNADAFVTTTVVPIALMLLINLFVISSKMKLAPLQFLRRELRKDARKKAFRLNTKIRFLARFRLRIIFQNAASYIVMIAGIILGAAVIIFGDLFGTMFSDYSATVLDSVICEYQYILAEKAETGNAGAEKYSMESFEFQYRDFMKEDISVYGIENDSRYVFADISGGKTAVSSTVAAKYGIDEGGTITLSDPYSRNKNYTFTVDSVYGYEASLAIFMSRESFNKMFGRDEDDYTGYFSGAGLDDIDKDKIAATVTANDYTKFSAQMEHSMGGFMKFFAYFGVIMFVLIMYILSKQVIERNFQSISMCKILGFSDGEIGSLYIISTSAAVVIGLLAAVPLTDIFLRWAFESYLYKTMTGYFPYNIRPDSFIKMIALGLVSYAAVAGLQMIKINRVPKGEALKNRE